MICVCVAVLYGTWRSGELRGFQAFVAALLGFYLADSGLAPTIAHAVDRVSEWVSTWQL